MSLEKIIKRSFWRVTLIPVVVGLVTCLIMFFVSSTNHGKAQALFTIIGVVFLGVGTLIFGQAYYLIKRLNIRNTAWQWKLCAVAPIVIPVGNIPGLLDTIQEDLFLSANVIFIAHGIAILLMSIWNFRHLSRAVVLRLSE